MKFCLDTSIFGGFFDQEFKYPTQALFNFIEDKHIKIVYSDILESELESAPEEIKLLATNSFIQAEYIDTTEEMMELAALYIKEGALTERSLNDAQHIAIATISGVSAIISWNFKHMANFMKIRQYNSINLREGYRMINIHTPKEIIEI